MERLKIETMEFTAEYGMNRTGRTLYISHDRKVDKFHGLPTKADEVGEHDGPKSTKELTQYLAPPDLDQKEQVDFIIKQLGDLLKIQHILETTFGDVDTACKEVYFHPE